MPEHGGIAWLTATALLLGYGVLTIITLVGLWLFVGAVQELWTVLTRRRRK